MPPRSLHAFREHRETMNRKILDTDHLDIKRFFALDASVYREGALDVKTKELLGLVASTVMRCDECILYHLTRCVESGVSDAELHDSLSVALVVGGSITIPHVRYAFEMMENIRAQERDDAAQG